jgi:2-polyprenyl-6-methoxyphenol hydroxylase-like FAD-dependent oxidoreductase
MASIGDAAHATGPHAGQGASIALGDALGWRSSCNRNRMSASRFRISKADAGRVPERVVGLPAANGNQKRESSRAGAWIRDRMLKLLIPLNGRSNDWLFAYDAGGLTPQSGTSDPRDRQAA